MGIKGELIDKIFNQVYASKVVILEFDSVSESSYIIKELNRRVHRTEKMMSELDGDVEENRIGLEWETWKKQQGWPKTAKVYLIKKDEVIKTFGFRIISVQDD